MKVKVHRGENQIGGNIIELSTETTRILLDVGLELDDSKNNDLPNVDGLFDRKGFDAVFITHYHGDHLGLAYKIHPDIPLYIGEASYRIVKASDDYKKQESIKPAGFLHHREQISIGDIRITPFLCDHSAFDSYMLLCEGSGEVILYTGDFRSNGRKTYEWLLKQLPSRVDKLICEGTTLSREGYAAVTESALEEKAVQLFSSHRGPIFVLQSSMNIDRIVTMYRAAKRCGRVFLEELYMADVASAAGPNIPNPAFGDVHPFITNPSRYEALCRYPSRVGKDYIINSSYVMCVRTSMLKYLRSLSEKMDFSDGILVYSFWNGYRKNDEMKSFLTECENMGLTISTLHTSGHADQSAIRKLIDTVQPLEIIPVHTLQPKWFSELGGEENGNQ